MELSDYFPIRNKLQKDEQQRLVSCAVPIHYEKGALIHTSGDCMGLILVTSGQLRAYTVSEDGLEITMYRLFERDVCLFSASCIMRSIQFDIAISAEKESDVLLIPADVYAGIMDSSAPLANFTNEVMASRFSDVMWLIEQIMWKSFDKRLAEFLLNESIIEESDVLLLTHETIGNHLGNPLEVVTRMLKYFQEEGIIKLSRGKIEIINRDGFTKILEE